MFDSNAEIALPMRTAADPAQLQLIVMRWPSDEEWYERAKRVKYIIKNLGRGVRETTMEDGGPNLGLFEKIKLNGAPTLTQAEATKIVTVIAQCDITNVQLDGDEAVVELQVMKATVYHRLKLPTADQVLALRRTVKFQDLPYNTQEMRIPLEPSARLWDACGGHSEDYLNGVVPALHKDTAVRGVIDFLDREMAAANDESRF